MAKRIDGLRVTLVEIDPALCALARENAALNGMADRVTVDARDVVADAGGTADRVLMNPPFNDPAQDSSLARRGAAAGACGGGGHSGRLDRGGGAARCGPDGTLTMIWRAEGLAAVETALRGSFGNVRVLPVLPREGADAIRVLVRAEKGAGSNREVLPGLIFNDPAGRPTPAAEAILREGKTLPLATI